MKPGSRFVCLKSGVSRGNRQRLTSGSGSPSLQSSGFRKLNSVGGAYMTRLTWIPGSTTISTEGGPQRRLYGP